MGEDAPIVPIAGDLFVPRPEVSTDTKARIAEAFATIPAGMRGALVFVADEHGPRVMTAAKFGSHWKAAAYAVPVAGAPSWGVAIMGAW